MDKLSRSILEGFTEYPSLSVTDIALLTNSDIPTVVPYVKWLFDSKFIEFDPSCQHSDTFGTVTDKFRITPPGRGELENIQITNKRLLRAEICSAIALLLTFIDIIAGIVLPG